VQQKQTAREESEAARHLTPLLVLVLMAGKVVLSHLHTMEEERKEARHPAPTLALRYAGDQVVILICSFVRMSSSIIR